MTEEAAGPTDIVIYLYVCLWLFDSQEVTNIFIVAAILVSSTRVAKIVISVPMKCFYSCIYSGMSGDVTWLVIYIMSFAANQYNEETNRLLWE